MKNIINRSLFLVVILLFSSCMNEGLESLNEDTKNPTVADPGGFFANATIELNNGEKWKVNEEMQPFLLKGEQIVNEYVANKGTDYKTLATQLKEQNDQLISSCTMDGKSHEVLHEWLHPHLGLVKELANAETEENANVLVAQIETSYKTFHQYFQ